MCFVFLHIWWSSWKSRIKFIQPNKTLGLNYGMKLLTFLFFQPNICWSSILHCHSNLLLNKWMWQRANIKQDRLSFIFFPFTVHVLHPLHHVLILSDLQQMLLRILLCCCTSSGLVWADSNAVSHWRQEVPTWLPQWHSVQLLAHLHNSQPCFNGNRCAGC